VAADRLQDRLLILAGGFLALYCLVLTLSPAVRENSWDVSYRLSHWIGFLAWSAAFFLGARFVGRHLPDRDPFLVPLAGLLTGWGLLTVWRLDASLGLKQAVWLVVGMAAAAFAILRQRDLDMLRRYKYLFLGAGLLLTALTLLLGTSPTGIGPRLWLGCCGLYFQPSEPLKLLLVVYLSAYLAGRVPLRTAFFPLLMPTLFVTGLALVLLIVQRDLGTASIFIVLYTTMLYMSTGRRRVLVVAAIALTLATLAGFSFVEVVHARLEAWINPWNDPSGRSYQIVQSLLSIANGGVFGRGPGLGSPSLVPVAHSDFIFSAIAEEMGLLGTVGLLVAYAILLSRGILIALRAEQRFHRLLSGGLSAYLGIQALLIIGGDLRLLPLTGVTLPFVSYGGSSLLTSLMATVLLLIVSNEANRQPALLQPRLPLTVISAILGIGIVGAALGQAWWSVVRGADLLARTDNPRRSIADRYVRRGSILDRGGKPIAVTVGSSGSLRRQYAYPALAPVTGYTHPSFGQAGLEASLDEYLRGVQGYPASAVWWHELVRGTPPPGLDVRLSIDLGLQAQADELMGTSKGAAVMLDARSGEIVLMASHPTYDPNQLDTLGFVLAKDEDSPLLNRATLGAYAPGRAIVPLQTAVGGSAAPGALGSLFQRLGFYSEPQIRMPEAAPSMSGETNNIRVSPLQMARAAAILSNGGIRPAPRIALAVNTPREGWVVLPALDDAYTALSAQAADRTALAFAKPGGSYWEWSATAKSGQAIVTWYVGGTLPSWRGVPLSLALLMESDDLPAAERIGESILGAAMTP